MEEVRLAVQRAIDKLVNRFGTTSDVISELEYALKALKKLSPIAKAVEPESATASSGLPSEEGSAAESDLTAEAEPPPQTPSSRRSTGRKR
jgi:hypothetical protein